MTEEVGRVKWGSGSEGLRLRGWNGERKRRERLEGGEEAKDEVGIEKGCKDWGLRGWKVGIRELIKRGGEERGKESKMRLREVRIGEGEWLTER